MALILPKHLEWQVLEVGVYKEFIWLNNSIARVFIPLYKLTFQTHIIQCALYTLHWISCCRCEKLSIIEEKVFNDQ